MSYNALKLDVDDHIATITHVPAVVWGAAWFLVATAGALYTLFLTSRRRSR